MPKVFISYRRDDSKHAAGRLHLALRDHMPEHDIFLDIQNIGGGVDFVEKYEFRISKSDVLFALIGPKWLEGRRLDNPDNHVRREILAAQKHSVPILPVLLDEAEMPTAALPAELQFLRTVSAERLTHEKFQQDTNRVYMTARSLAEMKTHSGPLPPLLQEQLDRELEDARNARRRRDLTRLPPPVKLVVEHAHNAEIKAKESQYRARSVAESAKVAARRAREGEAGHQDISIPIKGGGSAHWAGEGTYDQRNGLGEYSAPVTGGGHHSYCGRWKDNCESGFGITVRTYADGRSWRTEGEMAGGKLHGFGVEMLRSGDTRLGEFREGLLEGPGVYLWESGNRFEGEWRAGTRMGVQWFGDGSSPVVGRWDSAGEFQKL